MSESIKQLYDELEGCQTSSAGSLVEDVIYVVNANPIPSPLEDGKINRTVLMYACMHNSTIRNSLLSAEDAERIMEIVRRAWTCFCEQRQRPAVEKKIAEAVIQATDWV